MSGNHEIPPFPNDPDPYETITTIQLGPFHLLYLHPNDHPGLHLVNQALAGENFNQWKRAVTIVLSAKIKLGMINGTCVKPNPK